MSKDNIEPAPAIIGGINDEYLTGVGKLDGRLLILLDMDKILSDSEKSDLVGLEGVK
nr:chemotaxis protein CheW [Syntrophomonas palmitatica]